MQPAIHGLAEARRARGIDSEYDRSLHDFRFRGGAPMRRRNVTSFQPQEHQ